MLPPLKKFWGSLMGGSQHIKWQSSARFRDINPSLSPRSTNPFQDFLQLPFIHISKKWAQLSWKYVKSFTFCYNPLRNSAAPLEVRLFIRICLKVITLAGFEISDVLRISDKDYSVTFGLYFSVEWLEPRLNLSRDQWGEGRVASEQELIPGAHTTTQYSF